MLDTPTSMSNSFTLCMVLECPSQGVEVRLSYPRVSGSALQLTSTLQMRSAHLMALGSLAGSLTVKL